MIIMKNGKLQCKDVPDQPIIDWIAKQDKWTTHFLGSDGKPISDWSIPLEILPGNENFRLAKLRSMMKKRLIKGCDCGCRGDWEIYKDNHMSTK